MFAVRPPKRIANRIIILVLALELVSISTWGFLTYLGSERELLNTISSKLHESSIRTASDIGHFFDPLNAEVQAISKVISVLSIDEEQQRTLLYVLLKNRPEVEEISIIDGANLEAIRISRMQGLSSKDLRDLSKHELIHLTRKKQYTQTIQQELGNITFSKYSEPLIEVAYPIKQSSGIILLTVNLKWLWDTVQNQTIDTSGYVYVLNKDLKLIAHPDPSYVLKELRHSDTQIPDELFEDIRNHELKIYPSIDNTTVTGVSHFDKHHNWWIVVEQPVTEGLAPLTRVINQFISAFILTAFITIIIVVYFSRRTMLPLEKLNKGIALLASGDRDVQIEITGSSELSSLASSFNTMASSIDNHIKGILETQTDLVNSRKALLSSEQQIRVLLNSTAEAIYGIDLDGICTFCNPPTLRFLGYENINDIVGQNISDVIQLKASDEGGEHDAEMIECIHNPSALGSGVHSDDLMICKKDGTCFHGELRAHPVMEEGTLIGAVITFIDITERYMYQKAIKYQAYHDSLTGLPNRKLLHEHLDATLTAPHPSNQLALMLIDLDRFKDINDSLGHKSGDDLLKQLSARLLKLLDPESLLTRLGGDEFAILLRSSTSLEDAVVCVQEILTAIRLPFDLEGMKIQIDASIGITLSPLHSDNGSVLLRYADVAMYYAKANGLGYAVYDCELDSHSPQRIALLGELSHAIEDDQLTLYYQPKIHLESKKIIAYEALVRWNHPQIGLVLPDQFIPLAELGDLINPLTIWVVNKAIQDRQSWSKQGFEFDVAINVSVRNLQDIDLVKKIKDIFEENDCSPKAFEFEITESAIMTDPVRAVETMKTIYDLGIRISIDDYGTGYSSLAYLKKLPVDYLKIDKSFVMEMDKNENDALIVRSTIKLAHNLGLKVIAEGVENEACCEMLKTLGCDYAQGYFISKPMPFESVLPWSKEWPNRLK